MDRLGVKDMYRDYKKKNPGTDVTYALYKHTISEFCKKAVDRVLEGDTLYLGHKLGCIRIKKVPRNFDNPVIDWYETNKLKAEGINKHIYYTDPYWFRWYWDKSRPALKNKSVYKFEATKGETGNVKKLVRKIKNDPFAELNYKE